MARAKTVVGEITQRAQAAALQTRKRGKSVVAELTRSKAVKQATKTVALARNQASEVVTNLAAKVTRRRTKTTSKKVKAAVAVAGAVVAAAAVVAARRRAKR